MFSQKNTLIYFPITLFLYLVLVSALTLSGSIITLGKNIPQLDIQTDYIIGYLWSIVLCLSIPIWVRSSKDRGAVTIIWILKSCLTLGFMLLYESKYIFLDAYSYFDIPRQIDYTWSSNYFLQGTENIYNIVWLYYKIMPVSYHALKVSFSMIGLMAVYIFYRSAVIYLKKEDIRLLYTLSLFPSILFWSSIIGKDPVIMMGMALYAYGIVAWYSYRLKRYIGIILLGILFTMTIRYWMAPIMIVPLLILYIRGLNGFRTKIIIGTFIVCIVTILLFKLLHDVFAIGSFQDVLTGLDMVSRSWSEEGGSGQRINVELTSGLNVLTFIPKGMFAALFRPLPGEILNLFGVLSGFENFALLILFLIAIKRTRLKEIKDPIILWAMLLLLIWAVVYGFLSYQNLGTAVRFRLQILPIFLCLLLYLGRERRISETM